MDNNNVYHDTHYAEMKIQPIEYLQKYLSHEAFVGFLYGNASKYHLRAGHKAGESINKEIDKRNRYIAWYVHARRGKYIDPRLDYFVTEYEIECVCEEIRKNLVKMGK